MVTKSVSTLLLMAVPLYRMHTQTFDNVLEGIKEEDAKQRLNGRTNHIVWMAGNIVNCRYWLASVLGMEEKDPNQDLFAEGKALNESYDYPLLDSLKKEWHKVSPVVFEKINVLTEEELRQPYNFGMDVDFIEENILNMVAMCVDREQYLLGQLALMRKALGYGGMKYDMNKDLQY